ncbi:MAG: hypothetical protein IT306_13920 [Chloroflexi bacterium]|nr:hypothetical protein [Chloroflexota bacterium]
MHRLLLATLLALLACTSGFRHAPAALGAPVGQPATTIVLVAGDAASVAAVPAALEDAAAAGRPAAGVCLSLDALAAADDQQRRQIEARLRPALTASGLPVCLLVRPTGSEALPDDPSALAGKVSRARTALGPDLPVAALRLDLSERPVSPEAAAAATRTVGRLARELTTTRQLQVVVGPFDGVDAERPAGRSGYLRALGRWFDGWHPDGEPPADVASVALRPDRLPPGLVALAQDWLHGRGLTPAVQLDATTDAADRAVRPLLLAGGTAASVALTLPSVEPTGGLKRVIPGLTRALQAALLPRLELRAAPELALPGLARNDLLDEPADRFPADSNSPVHWRGDELYVFTSVGWPRLGGGPSLEQLSAGSRVVIHGEHDGDQISGMRWIEATYRAADGTLYGWYHEEPSGVCGDDPSLPDPLFDGQQRLPLGQQMPVRQSQERGPALTAPRIGALLSEDDGEHWRDLGIVLEAPSWDGACSTANRYFAGGVGDFSVLADREERYLYVLYTSFDPEIEQQGIGVARISRADLGQPVERVWLWTGDDWRAPGLGGRGAMVYPVTVDWHRADANGFWGPTVHWNTYLQRYAVVLNRAGDAEWSQAGAYVAFADRLDDPLSWTVPQRFRQGGDWYAQLIGTDAARRETDKLIGRRARYFERGLSQLEAIFHRPGE